MFSGLAQLSSVKNGDIESVSLDPDSAEHRQAAIAKLRQACRSEVQTSKAPPLPTGFQVLDASLGGGLPRGQIVEAVGKVGRHRNESAGGLDHEIGHESGRAAAA